MPVSKTGVITISQEGLGIFGAWERALGKARSALYQAGWDEVEVWKAPSPDIGYNVAYHVVKR